MNRSLIFIIGVLLGGLSWAVCPFVSNSFEPFDTSLGLAIGQIIMSLFLLHIGWREGVATVLLGALGLYLGQNLYSYLLGSSETKAWAFLLLFTSIFLCLVPMASGFLATLVRFYTDGRKSNS